MIETVFAIGPFSSPETYRTVRAALKTMPGVVSFSSFRRVGITGIVATDGEADLVNFLQSTAILEIEQKGVTEDVKFALIQGGPTRINRVLSARKKA